LLNGSDMISDQDWCPARFVGRVEAIGIGSRIRGTRQRKAGEPTFW
jgi:hypothetical protein